MMWSVTSDEYRFVNAGQLLGEGISKVKMAKHLKTGRLVAIKVFPKSAKLKQENNFLVREIMVLGGTCLYTCYTRSDNIMCVSIRTLSSAHQSYFTSSRLTRLGLHGNETGNWRRSI